MRQRVLSRVQASAERTFMRRAKQDIAPEVMTTDNRNIRELLRQEIDLAELRAQAATLGSTWRR